MTKKAWIMLADGFEETEAIGAWDVLQRGGIEAIFVSINDTLDVEGAHGLQFSADTTMASIGEEIADAIVLPGGGGGADNLQASESVSRLLRLHHDAGKVIGAICAAPKVLGGLGLLRDRRATSYPGFEKYLVGASAERAVAVIDGQIVTGRGPAYAFEFGVAILSLLIGREKAQEVADGLLITESNVERLHI